MYCFLLSIVLYLFLPLADPFMQGMEIDPDTDTGTLTEKVE